jgi:hypothetical protein
MLERRTWIVGTLILMALVAPRAGAQSGSADVSAEPQPATPPDPIEVEQAAPPSRLAEGPKDEPESRWFIGAFYRHTWTPAFLLKPFLQEVTSTNNHGAGVEATYSRSHLDITINGFWQGYRTYGPFLADGDPEQDTEMIDSSLSQAAIGVNFMWNAEISSKFKFLYGLDFGVGYVLGELRRTEAYRTSDPSAPGYKAGWAPCAAPGDPGVTTDEGVPYCDGPSVPDGEDGGHYNVRGRSWLNGGSVPNAWFRFAPHLALQYSPNPGVRIRVDGGFDLFSGFFAGGAIAFGL